MQSAHEAAGATGTRRSPRPLRGGGFINGSGALRGEGVNVCLMDTSTQRAQSSSPAKEPVKDTDLILRSLRSKRLEGWTQRRDSRPSFETRARGALLRMRSEIYSEPRKRAIQYSEASAMEPKSCGVLDTPLEPVIGLAEGETRWRSMTILARQHIAPSRTRALLNANDDTRRVFSRGIKLRMTGDSARSTGRPVV